jgi:hypothetical protein
MTVKESKPNILEQIAEICESRYASDSQTNQQMSKIKRLARQNANMLTQILYDYIVQNEPDPTYRKARLKAAKRMLGD